MIAARLSEGAVAGVTDVFAVGGEVACGQVVVAGCALVVAEIGGEDEIVDLDGDGNAGLGDGSVAGVTVEERRVEGAGGDGVGAAGSGVVAEVQGDLADAGILGGVCAAGLREFSGAVVADVLGEEVEAACGHAGVEVVDVEGGGGFAELVDISAADERCRL